MFGAIAAEVGTEAVFGAVLAIALVLAVVASGLPEAGPPERQPLREVGAIILSRPVLIATAFVAIPSLMFGVVEVLVPLRIDELGGGHVAIAGGFIAGAALEAGLAPVVGRYSDRVGRRVPFVAGIGVCAFAMVVLAGAHALNVVLAALILGALGAGLCFTPALTTLSDTAEASELHQGFAAGLSNMAWAAGQMLGAVIGGGVAEAAGYAAPSLAVAVLLIFAAYAYRSLEPPLIQPAEG
jgi:MFS family permease